MKGFLVIGVGFVLTALFLVWQQVSPVVRARRVLKKWTSIPVTILPSQVEAFSAANSITGDKRFAAEVGAGGDIPGGSKSSAVI